MATPLPVEEPTSGQQSEGPSGPTSANTAGSRKFPTYIKHDKLERLLNKLQRIKGPLAAIAAIGAILGGLAGYWNAYRTARQAVSEPVEAASAAKTTIPADAGPLSILVLPLTNQTGDANKAYIADALTSSISADLNRIRDAFVVPIATAFTYKEKNLTVAQVGKDAGVRFVLQGGVVASGDKLRINVQLADTQSGKQLWNETFEGNATNMFELQDLVTTRIGNSIGREIVVMAARESEKRQKNPSVADLTLRVRAFLLKSQRGEHMAQVEVLCRQILKLDPDNPYALLELANALARHAFKLDDPRDSALRAEKIDEARRLAVKAKALDPDNPRFYAVTGLLAEAQRDFAGSRRAAEERLAQEPKNPAAYLDLAWAHITAGEPEKGIELLKQAINLDPKGQNTAIFIRLSNAYFMLGDNDATIFWLQKIVDKEPADSSAYHNLAMAYAVKGDRDKARAMVNEVQRLEPGYRFESNPQWLASATPKFKQFWQEKVVPAARLAQLPE